MKKKLMIGMLSLVFVFGTVLSLAHAQTTASTTSGTTLTVPQDQTSTSSGNTIYYNQTYYAQQAALYSGTGSTTVVAPQTGTSTSANLTTTTSNNMYIWSGNGLYQYNASGTPVSNGSWPYSYSAQYPTTNYSYLQVQGRNYPVYFDSIAGVTSDLSVGSTGDKVTALQSFLQNLGYLTMPAGAAYGYFGNLTKSALAAYQASIGVSATGYFGPLTRAAIQAMTHTSGF